ncbi:hypothetical protein CBR_g24204 [Chara braunii]|uniref:Uncharacterized protein n=1 Tax=Chara braunii TaxID=69332 RepID=A0A388L631_CHABU|nr:hypothetical protein CBR_g24204 [Chara braunii]|eukprot:GBG77757.1 hypothetical protein CBR_g24204 [Chara braunii]
MARRGGYGAEEEDVVEEDDEDSEDDEESSRWGRRRDGRREKRKGRRRRTSGRRRRHGRRGRGGHEEGECTRKGRRRGGMEDEEVRGGGGDKEDEEGQEEEDERDEEEEEEEEEMERRREEETWRMRKGRRSKMRKLRDFHLQLLSVALDSPATSDEAVWTSDKAYLFAPSIGRSNDLIIDFLRIDWHLVDEVLTDKEWKTQVQALKDKSSKRKAADALAPAPKCQIILEQGQVDHMDASPSEKVENPVSIDMPMDSHSVAQSVFLVNGQAEEASIEGNVVTAIHSGKRYFVIEIHQSMDAMSPCELSNSTMSHYDYFKDRCVFLV